jgi:glucose-1-phosphate adenylyltransferase
VVSGAQVDNSVLSPCVHIHSYSSVTESVLLDAVQVGRHCTIRRAIIDKNVVIPDSVSIGVNHDDDRARGLMVTESGLVVIGKGQVVRP